MNILRIDSSPLKEGSVSRELLDRLQQHLESQGNHVTGSRDLYYDNLVTLGTKDRYTGYFTPADQQTNDQEQAVAGSNELVKEFATADAYIIAAPMYNFSVTAGLKTYIDLIARAGISFHYTAQGPEGLLKNKKAYIIVSTGGTPLGSSYDFVTPYLKTILGFLGITDITFIPADLGLERKEENIKNATATIQQIETV